VQFHGSCVAVDAFPIGIQAERFAETIQGRDVQERIRILTQRYQGTKLIVSVDRPFGLYQRHARETACADSFIDSLPRVGWADSFSASRHANEAGCGGV
jgi:hypothetical protein